MSMSEKYIDDLDKTITEAEVNYVNIGFTKKPVVDFAGMIIVGANICEFPELNQLPDDSDK